MQGSVIRDHEIFLARACNLEALLSREKNNRVLVHVPIEWGTPPEASHAL